MDDETVRCTRETGALPPVPILTVRRFIAGGGVVVAELVDGTGRGSKEDGGEPF